MNTVIFMDFGRQTARLIQIKDEKIIFAGVSSPALLFCHKRNIVFDINEVLCRR